MLHEPLELLTPRASPSESRGDQGSAAARIFRMRKGWVRKLRRRRRRETDKECASCGPLTACSGSLGSPGVPLEAIWEDIDQRKGVPHSRCSAKASSVASWEPYLEASWGALGVSWQSRES